MSDTVTRVTAADQATAWCAALLIGIGAAGLAPAVACAAPQSGGGAACPEDVNEDGEVDVSDMVGVILAWGACDQPCPPACDADVTGDCVVDVQDLTAVTLTWGPCEPCTVACDGIQEEEPCGEITNGGCNSTPMLGIPTECGVTICGTTFAEAGTRDTDWWKLTLDECTAITATLTSQFDGVVYIIQDICSGPTIVGQTGSSSGCVAGPPAVAEVGPGEYAVFVAPDVFEGFPCGTANDYALTIACQPCIPEACGKGAGDCSIDNGTPGCDDVACCQTVCEVDPFCCDVSWDGICADEAALLCGIEPCTVKCEGGTPEGEPCGDDVNGGGCSSTPPLYGSISCGETVCGTAWASGGTRDTDWLLVSTDCTQLTATLASAFPGTVLIVAGVEDCAPVVIGQPGDSLNCAPGQPAQAAVEPGTYVVHVATSVFDGVPCGTANDYAVTLECGECP